ncbi:hypothetical protein C8Q72DRAFT_776678 [Fomitopsis betulina]|nr:hypothetical protein C8Q72DRAFT_776678 [Fomitopsis betulina]
MPGHPLSTTKKQQIQNDLEEEWTKKAVQKYLAKKGKPDTDPMKKGLHVICTEIENKCFAAMKKIIKISKTTLAWRVEGGHSLGSFNAEKSWLDADEMEAILSYAIELANRGSPLSHKHL